MKTRNKPLFLLPVLLTAFGLLPAGRAMAQTFTVLHHFTAFGSGASTNSDGAYPNRLVLSGHTLYGTANDGGLFAGGSVFAVNTDGSGFTNLHSFTGFDGYLPEAGVILSGQTLYGTATTECGSALACGSATSFAAARQPTLSVR